MFMSQSDSVNKDKERDSKGRFLPGSVIGEEYRFKKGNIPWNSGTVGVLKANRTSFTKNTIRRSDYKTVHVNNRKDRGVVECTITLEHSTVPVFDKRYNRVYEYHRRVPYSRYLMDLYGINIPKGYVVFHKDGDGSNNDLDNLLIVSRKDLIRLNKGWLHYKDIEKRRVDKGVEID